MEQYIFIFSSFSLPLTSPSILSVLFSKSINTFHDRIVMRTLGGSIGHHLPSFINLCPLLFFPLSIKRKTGDMFREDRNEQEMICFISDLTQKGRCYFLFYKKWRNMTLSLRSVRLPCVWSWMIEVRCLADTIMRCTRSVCLQSDNYSHSSGNSHLASDLQLAQLWCAHGELWISNILRVHAVCLITLMKIRYTNGCWGDVSEMWYSNRHQKKSFCHKSQVWVFFLSPIDEIIVVMNWRTSIISAKIERTQIRITKKVWKKFVKTDAYVYDHLHSR